MTVRYIVGGKGFRSLPEVARYLGIWHRQAYEAMVRAVVARRRVAGVYVLTLDEYLEAVEPYRRKVAGKPLIRRPVIHGLGCLTK